MRPRSRRRNGEQVAAGFRGDSSSRSRGDEATPANEARPRSEPPSEPLDPDEREMSAVKIGSVPKRSAAVVAVVRSSANTKLS